MKDITKILILLIIPSQLHIVYGLVTQGAPFCYIGAPQSWIGGDVVASVALYACHWHINAFFESYFLHTLKMTLPVMLVVFIIYCVKNKRRVRIEE